MNNILHVCVMNIYSLEKMLSRVDNLVLNVMSNEEKHDIVYFTTHHWKAFSIFIEKAWEKRNDILCK